MNATQTMRRESPATASITAVTSAPSSRPKTFRRENLTTAAQAIGGLTAVLALWEILVWAFQFPRYLLVGPLSAFEELITRPAFYMENAYVTLQEAMAGFALGVALGVLCGGLLHYSKFLRSFLYPTLIAFDTIPKVALAPLFIVWFGFGFESKMFVAAAIAFFPLVINTYEGLSSVPNELKNLARINKAGQLKTMSKIDFIYALPSVFTGAKIAISLAVGGAVVGEFIAGSQGLGYVILLANSQVDLPSMFAAFFVLTAISLTLFFILDLVGKRLLPWRNEVK